VKLVELAFFTDDVASMRDFYRRLLGAEPAAESDGMAIFQMGHLQLFIHRTYEPAEGELPPTDHIAFAVEDVDAACEALIERGLVLETPSQDYYWGRSAYLRDPDGQQVEIIQADEAQPED
jgi:catechol 2,3-dioxygenase-like lactoylglutathione lyase family enzyme